METNFKMKKLFALAAVLIISLVASGQTSLDTMLFNKINEYRVSKKLKEIKWDTIGYKAARHHSQYLNGKNFISHYEDSIIYKSMESRYEYFGGKTDRLSEIIALGCCNVHDNDPSLLDKLAEEILNLWKKSPPHNRIILDPANTSGGGSNACTIREQGIRGIKNYVIISTFVFI
jgi:uncharacterized protein YkwD